MTRKWVWIALTILGVACAAVVVGVFVRSTKATQKSALSAPANATPPSAAEGTAEEELCRVAVRLSGEMKVTLETVDVVAKMWSAAIEYGHSPAAAHESWFSKPEVIGAFEGSKNSAAKTREILNGLGGSGERFNKARAILDQYLVLMTGIDAMAYNDRPSGTLEGFTARIAEARADKSRLEAQFSKIYPETRFRD